MEFALYKYDTTLNFSFSTNLLAPLYDQDGQIAFYLGGQINMSSNIHDKLDVMQVLAYTGEETVTPRTKSAGDTPPKSPFTRMKFPKPFRAHQQRPGAGMEADTLKRMRNLNLQQQMDAFHATYSKVCSLPLCPASITLRLTFYSTSFYQWTTT